MSKEKAVNLLLYQTEKRFNSYNLNNNIFTTKETPSETDNTNKSNGIIINNPKQQNTCERKLFQINVMNTLLQQIKSIFFLHRRSPIQRRNLTLCKKKEKHNS